MRYDYAMTRHGQRGDLDRKINAQISTAQHDLLTQAAAAQRVNVSTILRWLIDDRVGAYLSEAPSVKAEPKEA